MKTTIIVIVMCLGSAAPQDRPADLIVKEIDAATGPALDQSRRSDGVYFNDYLKQSAETLTRRAALIAELFEAHPDHARIPELLPKRWKALEWISGFEIGQLAPQVLKEIDAARRRHKGEAFVREARYWKAMMTFYGRDSVPNARASMSPAVDRFIERYPDDARGGDLLYKLSVLAQPDSPQWLATMRRLAKQFPDHRNAAVARGLIHRRESLGEPFKLEFTDVLTGRKVSTAALRGKVIVLDFWATWCPPCVAEHPHLKELDDKYRQRGLVIIGVSHDEPAEKGGVKAIQDYAQSKKLDWPQFHDVDRKFAMSYGILGIPHYFVIDKTGRLADASARGKLDEIIPDLLAK